MPKPECKPPTRIPKPRPMVLPRNDYQPTKAEMEVETDMPGMTKKQVRAAFFRPFRYIREGGQ